MQRRSYGDGTALRLGRPMMIRSIFLWIHVLCGAIWVAVSLSFVLAAGASTETERAGFASRVAPVLNRINLAAIVILPLTGIANLIFVARERISAFPRPSWRCSARRWCCSVGWRSRWVGMGSGGAAGLRARHAASNVGERRLLWLYSAMTAMGAVALMLGLWLAGSA